MSKSARIAKNVASNVVTTATEVVQAQAKSSFSGLFLLVLLVAAAIGVGVLMNMNKRENGSRKAVKQTADSKSEYKSKSTEILSKEKAKAIENEVSHDEKMKSEIEIQQKDDDPHAAFPSMTSEDPDDIDAQMAAAFTYENLQESMITSGKDAREAVKTRSAWSRFGERANPEIWDQQMEQMKQQIQESGQTLEQFMENSWAPIPEQMAAFWKESDESKSKSKESKDSSKQQPELKNTNVKFDISRAALSEAPSLTRDATQSIGNDAKSAQIKMREIMDARKRAKDLKLNLPSFSPDQLVDLKIWSSNKDKSLSALAKSLVNM